MALRFQILRLVMDSIWGRIAPACPCDRVLARLFLAAILSQTLLADIWSQKENR